MNPEPAPVNDGDPSPTGSTPVVSGWVDVEDRVTYAEAMRITGRSRGYLRQRVDRGELTRQGGTRTDVYTTWLSRTQVEELALRENLRSSYWITMTEAAAILGLSRTAAYRARDQGRLPAHQTATGTWLVRRTDAERLAAQPSPHKRATNNPHVE